MGAIALLAADPATRKLLTGVLLAVGTFPPFQLSDSMNPEGSDCFRPARFRKTYSQPSYYGATSRSILILDITIDALLES